MNPLRKIYSTVVNLNQWHNYGRSWLNIPFTFLSVTSSISILLLYFNLERSPSMLILLNSIILGFAILLGFFFFRSKAQMVDSMMAMWRSPLTALSAVSIYRILIEVAKRDNLPLPPELGKWGVKTWADVEKIYDYMLKQGENAHARPICIKFFEGFG